MRKSLLWQCIWPLLITFVIAAGTAVFSQQTSQKRGTRLIKSVRSRDLLNRGLKNLTDRHNRFIEGVKLSLLSNDTDKQTTALQWATQSYPPEMDRVINNMNVLIAKEFKHKKTIAEQTDLRRLEQMVARTHEIADSVSNVLELLSESLRENDFEATNARITTLTQQDRFLKESIELASTTIHRSTMTKLSKENSAVVFNGFVWMPLILWSLIAIWLVSIPLRRLGLLARGHPIQLPKTALEQNLSDQIQQARNESEHAQALVSERERESTRSQQTARRAEHELALLRIYNENLVNNLRSAVVVSDLTGTITSHNRTARILLGLPETIVGQSIKELPFYPILSTQLGIEEAQGKNPPTPLKQFEGVSVSIDGQQRLLDLSLVPFQDEGSKIRGFLWVADDVTDSVRMKNQLIASEHLATVGRMSAQVAHEIRNPLSAIGLNAELLEEEFSHHLPQPQGKEAVSLLKAIEHEIERLTEITEGYLQLTKNPKPSYQTTDTNRSINDLMTMIAAELRQKAIQVDLKQASPSPLAWADPGQLRQVLLNIIRNAEEAMPDGGNLKITTSSDALNCYIRIDDTGEGIPKESLHRVFEPFFTTKSKGTGLGLSVTLQMVKEHGGSVKLDSDANYGTSVLIQLPAPAST